jgi:hypothetical protein
MRDRGAISPVIAARAANINIAVSRRTPQRRVPDGPRPQRKRLFDRPRPLARRRHDRQSQKRTSPGGRPLAPSSHGRGPRVRWGAARSLSGSASRGRHSPSFVPQCRQRMCERRPTCGHVCRNEWHVIVGDADTFHLDEAARPLEAALRTLDARAAFTYIPGRTHFDLYADGSDPRALTKKIAAEMYAIARP